MWEWEVCAILEPVVSLLYPELWIALSKIYEKSYWVGKERLDPATTAAGVNFFEKKSVRWGWGGREGMFLPRQVSVNTALPSLSYLTPGLEEGTPRWPRCCNLATFLLSRRPGQRCKRPLLIFLWAAGNLPSLIVRARPGRAI